MQQWRFRGVWFVNGKRWRIPTALCTANSQSAKISRNSEKKVQNDRGLVKIDIVPLPFLGHVQSARSGWRISCNAHPDDLLELELAMRDQVLVGLLYELGMMPNLQLITKQQ
jgi:hypothetical protein